MTTLPGQALRHARTDDEQRSIASGEATTFRLQQQFIQAHGASSGQLTTLVTTSIEGGLFLCTNQQRQ